MDAWGVRKGSALPAVIDMEMRVRGTWKWETLAAPNLPKP